MVVVIVWSLRAAEAEPRVLIFKLIFQRFCSVIRISSAALAKRGPLQKSGGVVKHLLVLRCVAETPLEAHGKK